MLRARKAPRDKQDIYLDLKRLVSLKRKAVAEYSLNGFIDIYLKGIATHIRPAFHNEMLGLMANSVELTYKPPIEEMGQILPDSTIQGNTGQIDAQGDRQGEGGDPEGASKYVGLSTPKFSEKNETSVDRLNRLLFIAPRGFAKSSLCSIFFPLWLALYAKKQDIFIVSATMSLAKEMLRKIRKELEANDRLIEDFGEMKSDKWTEEMLVLGNGVIIRAKGREFQIRGFRPDIIICDDLEDEESLFSRDQRDKLENWFFRTLLPALKPDQTLIYVGTKLHQLALIGKLESKPEFVSRHFKALVDGKSIWEELWPAQRLQELKLELGTYAFEAEYQNNPISLMEQPIKPHYIDGVVIKGTRMASCLAIDPAISEKETADYRAFVIMERTEEGFREVFSEKGRWGVDEQAERIISLYQKYNPTRIIIEEVAFQKVFREILMKRAKEKGIYLPISEAELGSGENKRPRDKMTRLLGVSHLFEQRLVEIKNPDLRDELLSFPQGDYDDYVDACVYSLTWLKNYRTGSAVIKREKVHFPGAKESFYLKEIRPGVYLQTHEGPPKPNLRKNFISYG